MHFFISFPSVELVLFTIKKRKYTIKNLKCIQLAGQGGAAYV